MLTRFLLVGAIVAATLVGACSGSAAPLSGATCAAGSTHACVCPNGVASLEVCGSTGTFLACICAEASGSQDAGEDATLSAFADAGTDAGHDGGRACAADDTGLCTGKCGTRKDACGAVVVCGGCGAYESCGGAGVAGVCGTGTCTASCTGKACGASDGCGGLCGDGSCDEGQRCVAYACTCDATSCTGCCLDGARQPGDTAAACGTRGRACQVCASPTTCGTESACVPSCGESGLPCCAGIQCNLPATCGGGGTSGVCGCTPSCADKECGAGDGCGGVCETGSCAAGERCASGVCVCDAASCEGCCASGKCAAGTTNERCGAGGAACLVCSGPEACVEGECREQAEPDAGDGSGSGSGSSGSPDAGCPAFPSSGVAACDSCLAASCCALEAACQADLDCSLCIGDGVCCSEGEMPNCIHEDGNAMSLYECFQAACKTPCASLLE